MTLAPTSSRSGAGATSDGWNSESNTCAFVSADGPTGVFTIAADVTTKYSVGMRVRLTQTTVRYFIVTAVSTFSGGFTTITVYGGTNYTLANAAISSVSYSPGKTPFGFPTDTGSWTASSSSSSNVNQNSPTANTIYNLGSLTLSIPIGIWRVSYQAILDGQRGSAAGAILCKVGLSTVNNTFSDNNLVSSVWAEPDTVAADARAILSCYRFEFISLAAKTSYFLNANMNNNGVGLAFRGDIAPSLILAECVYL